MSLSESNIAWSSYIACHNKYNVLYFYRNVVRDMEIPGYVYL